MCGAAANPLADSYQVRGLSPRVRGSPHEETGAGLGEGSIPACAGQPLCPRRPAILVKVYPRVCGAASCQLTLRHH